MSDKWIKEDVEFSDWDEMPVVSSIVDNDDVVGSIFKVDFPCRLIVVVMIIDGSEQSMEFDFGEDDFINKMDEVVGYINYVLKNRTDKGLYH